MMVRNIIRRLRRCLVAACAFLLANRKHCYHYLFIIFVALVILFIQMLIFLQFKTPYLQDNAPVLGWENTTNRNPTNYILPNNITTVINNEICSKSSPPYVLLIVCSGIKNYDLRLAIRHTWAFAARQQFNISVAFLFGRSTDQKLNEQIKEENDIFGDIIVEDFIDTYNNLTLKSAMMLKWVRQNCIGAKYLMKTDDDVYINLYNLVPFLNSVPQSWIRSFLVGSLQCSAIPILDPTNKWYMPKYMFPEKAYPNYVSGVGYIMSMDAAMLLYRNVFKSLIIHMEDVFITGICAEMAGVKPLGHDSFDYSNKGKTKCSFKDVTLILHSHRPTSSQMFDIHYLLSMCDMPENHMFNVLNGRRTMDNMYFQNLLYYNSCFKKDMVPLNVP